MRSNAAVSLDHPGLADEREHVQSALPGARALISMAVRMNRDNCRSPARSVANKEFHQAELRHKLADRDAAIRDLEQFRELAISRLAAQHDEITRLRRHAATAMAGNVRSLTPRLTSQETS